MRRKQLLTLLFLLLTIGPVMGQAPKSWNSADIHQAIQKLNFLGSALYVAAHPDDENTSLIAYLSNEVKANTAYLSLTRGDGGQNEIGPEIRELLGLIRTQELLAARRTDGGSQLFTRANDFGYSKHPDETLEIWQRREVTADVAWAIRKWRPDIIINRFDLRRAGETHGHHTSSAILSNEVFDRTADENYFSEQLKYVDPWQPRRLFYNTSWWRYGGREAFAKVDKSNMAHVDIGVYYSTRGLSNTEISARSRSMHKSQGFGVVGSRGSEMEYLEIVKGDMPKDPTDLFEGINTTWTRVEGGAPIGELLAQVEREFDFVHPEASVPRLVKAYRLIKELPDGYWKQVKQEEIEEVIFACLGLFAEAVGEDASAVPGAEIDVQLEIINRSDIPVELTTVALQPTGWDSTITKKLVYNEAVSWWQKVQLPADISLTNPYWLNKKGDLGMYTVEDQQLRGLPETPRTFKAVFTLKIEGEPISLAKDVIYKYRDAVKGEVYEPFEITTPVFANLEEKVYVFGDEEPQSVQVLLKAGADKVRGQIELCHGKNWRVEPEKQAFELAFKGEEKKLTFQLFPPDGQEEGYISPLVTVDGKTYDREIVTIDYDHIPKQTVLRQSEAKVAKIDLKKAGERIGYIVGLGDEVHGSLSQAGYQVTILEKEDLNLQNLKQFDAVILGARVYNAIDLRFYQSALLQYVEEGGTMIVQYNKNFGLTVPLEEIAPYPLKISRDRVSKEDAPVRFLNPEHPILNFPNEITQKDFEGWVQERGLYFPDEWDEKYEAVISSNDPDETPKDGGLLVAKYGKGYYIYTGYSWFRELPAGVPGAFRIFANMISIGQAPRP
jgi:LmbE family N-acetylglucosaminyl deacetylase